MPEPAMGGSSPPTPPDTNPAGGGQVISLARHRPTPMREEPVAVHGDQPSPETRLALRAEAVFQSHDRTLTDPDTAEAFLATLEFVLHLAAATVPAGEAEESQHQELRNLVLASRLAPVALDPDRAV